MEKGPNGEQEVVIQKNTNERAVVRILVPKRTMTMSEFNAEQKKEEEPAAEGNDEAKKEGEEDNKAENGAEGEKPGSALSMNDKKSEAAASRSNMASRLSRVPSEKIIETD